MNTLPKHIVAILAARSLGQLSNRQQLELDVWLLENPENEKLLAYMDIVKRVPQDLTELSLYSSDDAWKKQLEKFSANAGSSSKPLAIKRLFTWASAVAAVLIVSFALYLFYGKEHEPVQEQVHLIKPGGNKATLTLANGEQIILSESESKVIVDTAIQYEDGHKANSDLRGSRITSFALNTPKGGQYRMRMPDGTEVWLNSETELKYRETEDARYVDLEGEAYFHVSTIKIGEEGGPMRKKPFFVSTRNQRIEVLGTQFNVKSFANDRTTATTLVEGSVDVKTEKQSLRLTPGEQALTSRGNTLKQKANLSSVLGWKQGEFVFSSESLLEITKQLERWYNVEFEWESKALASQRFEAMVSKNLEIREILTLLEITGKVKFKYKGNKILITKNK
ncbi:FecR family protein [Sphingobacterium hotanense]|uniref:FecR family protein n=1 Tax=Sphingobacterium hotanense TaxID=649196 RepID=UPI0011F39565|nr:FecR domain-containing protein [Sphingobacterium hotanense]